MGILVEVGNQGGIVGAEPIRDSEDRLFRSANKVLERKGPEAAELLSGMRSFGFRLRIQRPGSVVEAQRYFHGSKEVTVTPESAASRFREELQEALSRGGEVGDAASHMMQSLSFYPGMPGDTRSEKV